MKQGTAPAVVHNPQNTPLLKATLLVVSSMTIMAGATIAPALPQIEAHFTDVPSSKFLTQLMLTLPGFFIAAFAPVVGTLIDKVGRKKILLLSLLLYGISGSAGLYVDDLYTLLVSRAVLGLAVAGIMTISGTLVADYFEGEARNAFVGFRGAFVAFGGVVFIVLAGFLAELGWRVPFAVYFLAIVVLPFAAWLLYEPKLAGRNTVRTTFDTVPDYPKNWVRFVWVVGFFGMLVFYNIPTVMPFYLKEVIGLRASFVGFFIGGSLLVGGVGGFFYGEIKKRLSFNTIYAICFFLMGSCFLVISQTQDPVITLLGLMLGGLGMGLISPNHALCLMNSAPVALRGRILGTLTTFVFIGQFLCPFASEGLQALTGSVSGMFLVYGSLMLLGGVGFWLKRN